MFVADRSSLQSNGPGLLRTNGSSAGTLALLPPTQTTQGADPIRDLVRVGGLVAFQLRGFFEGLEPWGTDGSPGGTFALGDVKPGPLSSDAGRTAGFAGQLWFGAQRDDIGRELFRASGPPDSAQLFLDLAPLPVSRSSTPRDFQAADGRVYFHGRQGQHPVREHRRPRRHDRNRAARSLAVRALQRPRLGQIVEIQIDDAPPLSTTKLYVAAQPNLVPLGTCALYLTQPLILADLLVDGSGSLPLPFALTSNPIRLRALALPAERDADARRRLRWDRRSHQRCRAGLRTLMRRRATPPEPSGGVALPGPELSR